MEVNPLRATPELFAEYLSFLVSFAWKPQEALHPYVQKKEVDKKLFSFALLATGLCWVILLVARAFGAAEDKSFIVGVVGSLPSWAIPVLAVLLVLLVSVVFHVVATTLVPLWVKLKPRSSGAPTGPHLGGSIWDSVNAAFGFSAFYLPLFFVGYAAMLLAHPNLEQTTSLIVFLSIMIVLFGALLYYFPSALAGTHPNTSFLQAGSALTFSMTVLVVIRIVVEKIINMLGL